MSTPVNLEPADNTILLRSLETGRRNVAYLTKLVEAELERTAGLIERCLAAEREREEAYAAMHAALATLNATGQDFGPIGVAATRLRDALDKVRYFQRPQIGVRYERP